MVGCIGLAAPSCGMLYRFESPFCRINMPGSSLEVEANSCPVRKIVKMKAENPALIDLV